MNDAATIIQETVLYVQKKLAGAEGGHNWNHIERVRKLARYIREKEGKGEVLIIELAALLHDISDAKFNGGDEQEGGRLASSFLSGHGLKSEMVEHIGQIIQHVSFRGGFPQDQINTIEFQIVQDADRLDAMGAIGIARAFHYGGYKNRPIYDPEIPLRKYRDSSTYHQSDAPTINHFYEKLLKLKDLMNTGTGKALAEERHEFMVQFLEQFFREWDPATPDRQTVLKTEN